MLGDDRRLYPNLLTYRTRRSDDAFSTLVTFDPQKKTTTLTRQFVCNSLPERFTWLPLSYKLTDVEKMWLTFQVLCAVQQLHEKDLVHGDIKPDNFLLTSYDWLFLSDIHVQKPVLIDDENLDEYNKFFGHLDNNKQCFVAPEKWYSSSKT